MESKSKDKKIKNQNKEKNGNNFIQNESKKNSINKNTQVYTSNIKTIKNSIKDENKFENNKNKIYSQNKRYELSNSRKEALNKINKKIKNKKLSFTQLHQKSPVKEIKEPTQKTVYLKKIKSVGDIEMISDNITLIMNLLYLMNYLLSK